MPSRETDSRMTIPQRATPDKQSAPEGALCLSLTLPCPASGGHIPVRTLDLGEWAIVVPIRALIHPNRPHRLCPLKSYRGERGAIPEGIAPYARHTVLDSDGNESRTILEGVVAYACLLRKTFEPPIAPPRRGASASGPPPSARRGWTA